MRPQFLVWFISFVIDRKRLIALSVRQTSNPLPQRGISKLFTLTIMQFPDGRLVIVGAHRVKERSSRPWVRITLQELFLIWLGGRIASPRVWFGACGQGVTLKLAWGPSNFSPWNICILFLLSFLLFPLLISIFSNVIPLSFFTLNIYWVTVALSLIRFLQVLVVAFICLFSFYYYSFRN